MKKKNFLVWFASLAVIALLLSACGGEAETVEVEILKFSFIPETITIKVGDTVRWVNKEKRQYHSIWFEELGEEEPVDYFFPDENFERSFKTKGTFNYRCGPHEKMKGVVIVK